MTYREAVIEGSETRVLRSDLTGKDYLISVGLPYGYHDEPEKNWPVVYLIDGNMYFGMVTEIVRSMAWCGSTSDAIVAGIGYATETQMDEAWMDRVTMRMDDLSPVRDEEREKKRSQDWKREVKTGGAANFLEFIGGEVMSLVESNYRVDTNDRTLAGHSLGGLFPLFAMFQDPGQFTNYVACSPSIYWKGQVMLEIEKLFASEESALPARLFLSMGELEKEDEDDDSFEGMMRLFDQLESREYKQFEMVKKLFPDEDHCTVLASSFAAGLKWALRKQAE
jgi:predicted alpha/beta superfamily hydrolase